MSAQIFVSSVRNPYENLALEHFLFQTQAVPTLFLYVNQPCVVIGRAQNPWIEANLPFLKANQMPLVRRQSGGGTVVHDLGNLNFSFISPKAQYDKKTHLQMVLNALITLGIPAQMNERHDLIVQDKKISGSAFRETRENCFHHGTLLIHSDLAMLREALAAPPRKIKTNAIRSVRSSVMNLTDFMPDLSLESVKKSLIQSFENHHQQAIPPLVLDQQALRYPLVVAEQQRYQSLEWIYHKTLPFEEEREINGQKLVFQVESGRIIACKPPLSEYAHWLGSVFDIECI
ncbi:MAG: lipoate--protein ligase [Gammaproteobacteria bacterium]|nr:lipoate--protein ligase [Gammaproteobacteria bacterium]